MTDDNLIKAKRMLEERGMADPVMVHVLPVRDGWIVCAEGVIMECGHEKTIRDWIEII